MRLAISRNEYLNFIKNDQSLKTYDLMIVLDCGGVNGSLTAKDQNAILENENSIEFFLLKNFYIMIYGPLELIILLIMIVLKNYLNLTKKTAKLKKFFLI